MGMRTELSTLEAFLEQLTKLPKSAGAISDLYCLTQCVSYVVAKLVHVTIIGAAPRAQEVAVQLWLPLFAGRSINPLFDRASNPDVRVLTLPEDVDTLLKPTSKFVQAVTYWAEVQVNATDTGFAMDNVKNVFKGSFKSLHESNTDSPHLSELAGLVIACILKQRGLMHVATTLNACMTWSKIPKAIAFVLRDAYISLRAFAKEPTETSATAKENALNLCKLFLASHNRTADADGAMADEFRRSQSAVGTEGHNLGQDKPSRSASAPSGALRNAPRWQLVSKFSLALGTLKSSQLQPSISSVQHSSAFAPTIPVENFVFSNSSVQDLLTALADQEDRCLYRTEGFRVLQNLIATTMKSSPLVLPIALGFFDSFPGEPSRSVLSEFYFGDKPDPAYSKGCEGVPVQQISSMVEAVRAFKSIPTATLLETTALDYGLSLLCFDSAVYTAPLTALLGELQSDSTSEDQLAMVSAQLASILQQLYMCCLQHRVAPDAAQMELVHRIGTCLVARFTPFLSIALGTLVGFLWLISTDLGFLLPEATWLPVLNQILRLKLQDNAVRRVPVSSVLFPVGYIRHNH